MQKLDQKLSNIMEISQRISWFEQEAVGSQKVEPKDTETARDSRDPLEDNDVKLCRNGTRSVEQSCDWKLSGFSSTKKQH